uniref:Uncharacterized protein n=1 Tax=Cajanus cajan TaxID=3821 RepID=A0A151SQM9_CAJCA|nr:hypothetical protein KK1_003404 [Cajanus cajan]
MLLSRAEFFTLFAEGDEVVRVNRDFKVAFSAATLCLQGTEWKVGEKDAKSGRRIIVAWGNGSYYFRILETQFKGSVAASVGALPENGKILLALDGNVLPVVFERA